MEGCTTGFFFTRLWTRPSFCFPELFFSIYISFCLPNHNFLLWPSCEQTQCCNRKWREKKMKMFDSTSSPLNWMLTFQSVMCCLGSILLLLLFMMRCQETRQETISRIDGGGQTPIMTLDFYIDVWCSWTSRIFRFLDVTARPVAFDSKYFSQTNGWMLDGPFFWIPFVCTVYFWLLFESFTWKITISGAPNFQKAFAFVSLCFSLTLRTSLRSRVWVFGVTKALILFFPFGLNWLAMRTGASLCFTHFFYSKSWCFLYILTGEQPTNTMSNNMSRTNLLCEHGEWVPFSCSRHLKK